MWLFLVEWVVRVAVVVMMMHGSCTECCTCSGITNAMSVAGPCQADWSTTFFLDKIRQICWTGFISQARSGVWCTPSWWIPEWILRLISVCGMLGHEWCCSYGRSANTSQVLIRDLS